MILSLCLLLLFEEGDDNVNYNEFVESLENELNKRGILYTHDIVQKDGEGREAIICQLDNKLANPILYLANLFEDFSDKKNASEILDLLIKEVADREEEVLSFLELMHQFNLAAPHLTCKLINRDKNKKYVKNKGCIYKEFLNLYIIPVVSYGELVVEITEGIIRSWGASEEDVIDTALKNLKNEKVLYRNIEDFLDPILANSERESEIPMYVLSNPGFRYGANKILVPSILKEVEKRIGGKYWILPSSRDECIIVPSGDLDDLRGVKTVVKEANFELGGKNYLSDSVYEYTGIPGKEIIIVGEEV